MWCALNVQDVSRKLKTNIETGLTDEEAKKRQEQFGKNKLNEAKKTSIIVRFLRQFNDFMIIILLISAGISAGISYFEHSNDYIDSIIIVGIVILNAIMGVIQESKAEKSIEALQKLSSPQAKVKRNGQSRLIASEELVPGDIVYIEAGNYVPADVRLINAYNFKVEESALTGETIPVEKNAEKIINGNSNLGDMENLSFSTTIAVSGHAEGIVTETGMNTKVGKIAQMIITDESPETPLQKRLRRCRQKAWNNSTCNLCISIFYRTCKTYTSNGNIYGISRTSGCCNSRGITNSCYNNVINWNYKNGKEK
jgi:Ca2+-transporting ATPase